MNAYDPDHHCGRARFRRLPGMAPWWEITGFPAFVGGRWLELLSDIAALSGQQSCSILTPLPHGLIYPRLRRPPRSLKLVLTARSQRRRNRNGHHCTGARAGGGLVFLPDIFTFAHRASIISVAARNNVPAVYRYQNATGTRGTPFWIPRFRRSQIVANGTDVPGYSLSLRMRQ